MTRITADPDVCISAGQCVLTDPTVFGQDDDDTVVLLAEDVDGEQLASARRAVQLCPSGAIALDE